MARAARASLGPLEELVPTSQPVPTARSCHGDPLPPSTTAFPVKPLPRSILPDRHACGPHPPRGSREQLGVNPAYAGTVVWGAGRGSQSCGVVGRSRGGQGHDLGQRLEQVRSLEQGNQTGLGLAKPPGPQGGLAGAHWQPYSSLGVCWGRGGGTQLSGFCLA